MRVFGVVYASVFDEDNIFLREEDAKRFKRHLCRRHKLKYNDPMLRILPIEVHESYDPNKYLPHREPAKPEVDPDAEKWVADEDARFEAEVRETNDEAEAIDRARAEADEEEEMKHRFSEDPEGEEHE